MLDLKPNTTFEKNVKIIFRIYKYANFVPKEIKIRCLKNIKMI